MNNAMVSKHYVIGDDEIDSGEIQKLIQPMWWSVSIYDGETEMYDALEKFSEPQKYVWAIQWYISEVINGGHYQFYSNSSGIVWEIALEGLREIGCDVCADILQESANRLGGMPSLDRETRWEEMERHNAEFDDVDDEFYENDSILYKAVQDYIFRNRSDFYFDGIVEVPEFIADEACEDDDF